jgi:hypothetical protein
MALDTCSHWNTLRAPSKGRLLAATLIVLFAVGGAISAWTVAAGLAALTVALCAAEGFTARAAAD